MVTATREPDLAYEIDPDIQDQLTSYGPGTWVALTPTEIIAVGESASEAYDAARRAGIDDPILYEVPSVATGSYFF